MVKTRKHRISEAGFTLIELIVVIVILGILASLAMPRFVNLQHEARVAKLQAARGAVMAASALVHGTALVRAGVADTTNCAGGVISADNINQVCTENGLVDITNGYPGAAGFGNAGILAAAGLTGVFNPTQAELEREGYTYSYANSTATFGIVGSGTPGTCQFTYTPSAAAGAAPVISAVATDGC
jgi:MSHA pilin protein MshA